MKPHHKPYNKLSIGRVFGKAVLALAAAGLACPALAQAVGSPPAKSATLAVAKVAYREVREEFGAEATVEAVRQSTLAAQVSGQIVEWKVKVGDKVQPGQVLARIDQRAADQTVAASAGQLAEAQAALASAQAHLRRNQKLFEQKFISQAGLEQAESDVKAANARVASLQANAGQAATAKSYATISAPYAGVVSATMAELGDLASPGRPLLTLFDPSALRVTASVPQSTLRAVKLELPARVEFPDLKRSVAAGAVTLVPVADSRSHNARLRLDVAAVDGMLPGQFARAWLATGSARRLVLPERAVLRRSELTAAYVVDGAGRAALRQIRVGEAAGEGMLEVLAGLREGEQVALDPVQAGMAAAPGASK